MPDKKEQSYRNSFFLLGKIAAVNVLKWLHERSRQSEKNHFKRMLFILILALITYKSYKADILTLSDYKF